MTGLIIFGTLLVFITCGIPCAFGIVLASLAYLIPNGVHLSIVSQRIVAGMNSFVLLAIPLFTITGYLMEHTSLSRRLVEFIEGWIGGIRGSAGIVTIIACAIFAALTGSGPATVAAIGAIMLPALDKAGYSKRAAAGMVASGGALGPIIPPSTLMIVYGAAMGESVAQMFIGGVIPGIIVAVAFCCVNMVVAKREKVIVIKESVPLKEKLRRTWRALPALVLPVIILGGIYGGIVTPSEAAVLSVVYALLYGLISREINVKEIYKVFEKGTLTSATVIFVIAVASVFSWVLSKTQLPAIISAQVMGIVSNKYVFMLLFLLILFVVGCLMDGIPSVLILAPILAPIGISFGYDSLHIGVLFTIAMVAGFITPPFGVNLFTAVSVSGEKYEDVLRGALPYLVVMILCVFLFAFVPELITWLPELAYG